MNLTRDHSLADAALPTQQHADIVVRDAIDHGHHRLHGLAGTPARLGAVGILANLRAQPLHFAGQRQALENAIERAVLGAKSADVQPSDLPEPIRGDAVAEDAFTVPPHHTLAEIERIAVL